MTSRPSAAGIFVAILSLWGTMPAGVLAQATRPATTQRTPASGPAEAPPAKSFTTEQLEQVVAPVALYPDSLLAQVFMASTYPLEVVQADRWLKENPKLKDSPEELNKLPYDASVKSLLDFPQVLSMMSQKLDWTLKLGDAFIADQKATMDAVQRLRKKAYTEGNLKSSKEQKVSVEQAPAATAPAAAPGVAQAAPAAPAPQVIVVESTSPSVVYVPTYNPTVVYGAWPYPASPPYYYTPPGYVAGTALLSFGVGVACGAAWGHAWGNCNWHGGDVDVDVNKNVNFNNNIDRDKAQKNIDNRQADRSGRQGDRQGERDTRQGNRQGNRTGSASTFQHDPSHRKGVSYRDTATNEKFRGANASQSAAQSREAYRGRAETGRQDLSRGSADSFRGSGAGGAGAAGARSPAGSGGTFADSGRGRTQAPNYSGTRSSGFSDAGTSNARTASNRGQTSRSSGGYSSSSSGNRGSFSGSSRSSGGGSRGGGGRGGGRR